MNKKGFVEKNEWALVVATILIALYIVLAFMQTKIQNSARENENIERSYADVITKLNMEPKNFTNYTYESAIPKMIKKDMQKVAESEAGISAIYTGKDTKMVISKNEDCENGVAIALYRGDYRMSEVHQNISFYTDGHSIFVYGNWYKSRELSKYVMSQEDVEEIKLDNPYLDLYGTDVQWDDIRTFLQDSTLVRCKEDFYFYYLGSQIGSSYRFPSGTVKEMDYDKILNDQNDMYYLFYSSSVTNPWIVFSKVANKVDYIIDTSEEYFSIPTEDQSLRYPIFVKDEKKYCGIPDLKTAIECSQDNGGCEDSKDVAEYAFDIQIVEISENTAFRIFLNQNIDKNWYIVYWYETDDRVGYMRERIYGLDSGLVSSIPEEKLKQYDKEISANDIDRYVQELRALYDEYVPRKAENM